MCVCLFMYVCLCICIQFTSRLYIFHEMLGDLYVYIYFFTFSLYICYMGYPSARCLLNSQFLSPHHNITYSGVSRLLCITLLDWQIYLIKGKEAFCIHHWEHILQYCFIRIPTFSEIFGLLPLAESLFSDAYKSVDHSRPAQRKKSIQ